MEEGVGLISERTPRAPAPASNWPVLTGIAVIVLLQVAHMSFSHRPCPHVAAAPSVSTASVPPPPLLTCTTHPPDIDYYYANLPHSTARREHMESAFERQCIPHPIRVDSVDGYGLDEDPFALELFGGSDAKRPLLAQFPKLLKDGHHGTKGVWMTTMKIWKQALAKEPHAEWVAVFQDDADLDVSPSLLSRLAAVVEQAKATDANMVWLDKRSTVAKNPGCCLAGVLFKHDILPRLLEVMHPLHSFPQNQTVVEHDLFDLVLSATCVSFPEIHCLTKTILGVVGFASTISMGP